MSMETLSRFKQFFVAGHNIFSEGDVAKHVYFILDGSVEISMSIKNAHKTLATLEKGDIFGEMAVVDTRHRSATAIAKTETTCLALDATQLDAMIRGNSEFSLKLIRLFSKKLRDANEQISELIQRDRKKQIMIALNHFAQSYGESGFKGKRVSTRAFVDASNSRLGLEKKDVEVIIDELITSRLLAWGVEGKETIVLTEKFRQHVSAN